MKKIYSLFVLLLCCVAAEAQISIMDAEYRIVQSVRRMLADTACVYDYYLGESNRVMPSKVITPTLKRAEPVWVVFVDEEPGSGWEHPCKYVYLPKTNNISTYEIIDSVCPPADVELRPVLKPDRYGTNAKKHVVEKIQSNDPNVAAGNTYAVILNGGMSPTANRENYWNDCSFIYKTLRNRYEIPKGNIKVVMSDGADEGADMNPISGDFVSSPLDLDDDGQPDIEYAATKENLQQIFGELAQKLTDNDHLMLFVTDHGGWDKAKKTSFIYLWDSVKLYPQELASYLDPVNAGFISVVMGQCYSGGFIGPLQKTNRIIATACSETERSYCSKTLPYNEFLYHWTSALNGYDAVGKKLDCGENIPIADAQLYAAKHDFYANDGTKFVSETPQINYFTNSVASDLSLAYIPPTVDLVFDEYKKPLVSELKTKAYKKGKSIGLITRPYWQDRYGAMFVHDRYAFWNNPYIWLRNNEDGEENQKSEKLIIEKHKPVFVYFKVRNRGVKDYTKGDQTVRGYWTKSDVAINLDGWKGRIDEDCDTLKHTGGTLGSIPLDFIPAGGSGINCFWYSFNKEDYKEASKPDFNMCTLIYIRDAYESGTMPVDEDRIVEVWKTNKLGQSNLSIVSISDSMRVSLSNWGLEEKLYDICLVDTVLTALLFREANVSMNLSSDLTESWNKGGQCGEYVELDKNKENSVMLKSNVSKLKRLKMAPYQSGRIGLACNFFANKAITERKQYDVDVALVNSVTGKCVGGESFRIIQEPRPAINPVISANMQSNGKTMLEATNVDEDVIYKWYDATGAVVGTGATFEVPSGAASSYTVRAESVSDGAISDSAPVTAETSTIKAVDTQSCTDAVDVRFYEAVPGGVKLCLTSSDGRTPATYYNIENGASGYAIPAMNLPSGIYQVTMIQNGNVTGIKKFVK